MTDPTTLSQSVIRKRPPEPSCWVRALQASTYARTVAIAGAVSERAVNRPALDASERLDLARALLSVSETYDRHFGFSTPYVMAMHQAPTDDGTWVEAHFHVEFYPPHRRADRLKYLAGVELGAGTFVNDTMPEETAAQLRKAAIQTESNVVARAPKIQNYR